MYQSILVYHPMVIILSGIWAFIYWTCEPPVCKMVLQELGHLVVFGVRTVHWAFRPPTCFNMSANALLAKHFLAFAALFGVYHNFEADDASENIILIILQICNFPFILRHFCIEISIMLVNQELFDGSKVYLHLLRYQVGGGQFLFWLFLKHLSQLNFRKE